MAAGQANMKTDIIELRGIKTEPDGSETELVIRVHPPKKGKEARH